MFGQEERKGYKIKSQNKDKISVCLLTLAYPGKSNPVHGVFIENQARLIKALGYRPVVIAPRVFFSDPLFSRQKGLSVYRFPYLSGNRRLGEYKRMPFLALLTFFLSGFWRAAMVIKKEGCQLIHAHWVIPTGLLGWLVAKKTGLPLITTAHGSDINLYSQKNRLLSWITSLVLKKSSLVIAVSSSLQAKIIKDFKIPPEKVKKIPIGLDFQDFYSRPRNQVRKKLKLPARKKILLFAGGLAPDKGFETLKEAFPKILKSHPQILLLVLGKMTLNQIKEIKREAKKEGWEKNIRFFGERKPSEMPLFLSAANLVAIPSFHEGLGQIALEALACETPVVVSAVGDLPEIVKMAGGGSVFKPKDASQLASQIISYFNQEKKSKINKKFLLKEFDLRENTQKLVQIYNSFLNSPSPYQSNYYERLIKEYKSQSLWSKNRVKNVLQLASPLKRKMKILDLGCGAGIFLLEFSRRGAKVYGVDSSAEALKATVKLFSLFRQKKQPFLFQANITSLPFKKDQFDLVVCADLVEHLYPDEFRKMLKEARRVLKPGGKLLIYTPCPTHIFEIMRKHNFILKKDVSHVDLKNADSLIKSLKKEKFKIDKAYYTPSHIPLFNLLEIALMPLPVIGNFFRRRICLLAQKTSETEKERD